VGRVRSTWGRVRVLGSGTVRRGSGFDVVVLPTVAELAVVLTLGGN
jgi:hypothetical protein